MTRLFEKMKLFEPGPLLTLLQLILLLTKGQGWVIEKYLKDMKLLPPYSQQLQVASIQLCIHRCRMNKNCNVANVRILKTGATGVECILARLECFVSLHTRASITKGWDLYPLRNKVERPFHLAYKGNQQNMCVKVNSQGHLTITHQCQMFCINEQKQMMHVISRKCMAFKAKEWWTGNIVVTTTCNSNSVFVEVLGTGVKHVKSSFYMHAQAYEGQPPPGILVILWYSGYQPFFFDFMNDFF